MIWLYSLPLLFCVSVSSSELEPEPMEELSWLSWGQVRKTFPSSDRDGVSVRERILSRLFGLINFLIFKVIQLPRLQRADLTGVKWQINTDNEEAREFLSLFTCVEVMGHRIYTGP